MRNIICFLFGHRYPSQSYFVLHTRSYCKRCKILLVTIPTSKSKKPVIRYIIKESKKNQFVARCNIPNLTATGISYRQAHNNFFLALGKHFKLDIATEMIIIRDMKVK